MYTIPSYSMLTATATTFLLSIIFLMLSKQTNKHYMLLWGISWLLCSSMFILDFFNLFIEIPEVSYIMFRQILTLIGAHLFLLGTYHFFQLQMPSYFHTITVASTMLILTYHTSDTIYHLMMIPNIMICSGMIIVSGCMFIAISWTQKLHEKVLASFFIILWSIFINHFGFTLKNTTIATITYFIGLIVVNCLMLTLIIMYFKKLRFLDNRNSERFRLLVENSSDSMFLYDYKAQTFEYISPHISNLVGLDYSKLYNNPDRFFDYITMEEKNKEAINIFSRPVTTPGSEVLCLYKNGEINKWSEMHYIPIYNNSGSVTAVEGILKDITEQKKMQQELKMTETAKREFLENISHEIKTPVTLIRGYTESMLDNLIPKESTDTYLKIINSKATMIATLLDDLTQLSDFTSQTMEYKFYEQSANELFEEFMNQSKAHIIASNHLAELNMNITPDAIVITDPYRIQQIISNLLNNAIRHTPEGNKISISCNSYFKEELLSSDDNDYNIPKGDIVFTVSDTGDGIPEKDLKHIFERNFSGSNRIHTNSSKTGLGLYISKQIITQHSGHISARNNPDCGASITFSIPYYK